MGQASSERSARERELFAWFNRHRDDPGPDQLGDFLADPDLRPDWRDLASLGPHRDFSPYVRAPHVAEFFVAYAKLMKPRRILDPYFFSPVVASALAEELPDTEVVAVSPFAASVGYGELLSSAVQWRQQDPVAAQEGSVEEWDLIVGSPPIGLRHEVAQPSGDASSLSPRAWRQEATHLVIAAASGRLAAGGKIAVLLGEGSIFSGAGHELEEWLAARGIYLEASVSVLGGLPAASVDTQISVFGQDACEDLFIARLSAGAPIAEVVANLDARSVGDAPELGMRTDRRRYHGWRAAMARIGLEEALAGSPSVSRLGKVSLSIQTLLLRQGDPSPDFENAIYLPAVGEGPARTRVDRGGKAKTRTVVVIQLDPEQVDAEYLAYWLNGPGRLSRQSVMGGGALPRALLAALRELLIPLPPLDVLPTEVVNTADRRPVSKRAVWPAPVVVAQEGWQGLGPLG